jgi:hypothetical protein
MSFNRSRTSNTAARRAGGCAIVFVVAAIIAWFSRPQQLPQPAIHGAMPPAIERCAACHAEHVEAFQASPHATTLRRMNDWPQRTNLAQQTIRLENGLVLQYGERPDGLRPSVDGLTTDLNWVFGSGRHANTPVAVWENPHNQTELLEHRVSLYPQGQWHPTLGLESPPNAGIPVLGKRHPSPETLRCFGCHSTRVPHDQGSIDFAHLVANVQCERCHQGTARHLDEMERGSSATGLLKWKELTSRESINRCGECHRRADEFTTAELRPDNERLVRFAPVGLSLSPCFAPGADRPADQADSLTCMHCHDPHQSARSDAGFYRQRCLTCHAAGAGRKPCSSQPPESHCTTCHMPKVTLNPWLSFTNHWIRRREGNN